MCYSRRLAGIPGSERWVLLIIAVGRKYQMAEVKWLRDDVFALRVTAGVANGLCVCLGGRRVGGSGGEGEALRRVVLAAMGMWAELVD